MNLKALFTFTLILIAGSASMRFSTGKEDDEQFITYKVDAKKSDLRLYWKNDKNELFNSLGNLKTWVESKNKKLLFAMNGGMYMENRSPLGLYIENTKQLKRLNTSRGSGIRHVERQY